MTKQKFGEFLISKGVLNKDILERTLKNQTDKEKLGQTLIKEGIIRKERLSMLLADYFGMEYMPLADLNPDPQVSSLIPYYIAKKLNILPISIENDVLSVATSMPPADQIIDNLKRITGKQIRLLFLEEDVLAQAFYYIYKNREDVDPLGDSTIQAGLTKVDAKNLVEDIVQKAVEMGASDIHFEPEREQLRVRFRIDGILKTIDLLPESMTGLVLSRIKVLANMNIAERRAPQDGAFQFQITENGKLRTISARASTIPSLYGEKAVLRIQAKGKYETLESLGFEKDHLDLMHQVLAKPHGIFLTTGPSGSGKTTTLYAALKLLRSDALNIVTVEDPVERPINGITQTEIDVKYGYGTALRSILRQDPDVIMIGEIRDGETARMALQAALTGHLVLSTLHTNDATSAVAQLIDMGCEQFLVNTAVNAVLAQRLVRMLCPDCKYPYEASREELISLGLDPNAKEIFYKSEGCPSCRGTQYKGRIGIYELLILDTGFKKLVSQHADPHALREYALKNNMRPLREDGIIKMRKGLTSFSEVVVATSE